jgi:GTP-binding protein HflX
MTNAHDFNLDAELDATDDWEDQDAEPQAVDTTWVDQPDPEDEQAEPTAGAMQLA